MSIQILSGGTITAPKGFLAGAAQAAIKKPGRYDLTLIYSPGLCSAAGVFTRNKVQAAPVLISKAHLAGGQSHGVVVNSGCANACTGAQGDQDALQMAAAAGKALGCPAEQILVASTGVIGAYMPMERVLKGIQDAAAQMSADCGALAAQAIMTTDTVPKEVAVQVLVGGTPVTVAAMAKGSGMIHPDMATMLGFITTDAAITPALLQTTLSRAADATFNMVTVDGDTSTNDSLFALANGEAKNPLLAQEWDAGYGDFAEAVVYVCRTLAKMIAKDGEGATKFLAVRVEGAATLDDARRAAKTIAGSSLVKAAIYGKDANWGRMICALGYSGAQFDPMKVDMFLGPIQMMAQGSGLIFDEAAAKKYFEQDEIQAVIQLHDGDCSAEAWGCDLTHEYVTINADYRS